MEIGLKKLNRSFALNRSLQLFILINVVAILNIHQSKLLADELRAHPSSIVFNALKGQDLNVTHSIFIFAANESIMSWSASKNASWLTINLSSGDTEGILKIGVNTNGLLEGIYNGNITIQSPSSSADPVIVSVTLIINPDVPIRITTWKDGFRSAMSVSVDDSQPSGYDELVANGFVGTYVAMTSSPPSFYTNYYYAGMELGSHTVNHRCYSLSDYTLRYEELEPSIQGLISFTPEPAKDIISLIWPCGYTNYREQAIASEYFLSARGYNINQLEDATPDNFMNLKSYNSHEHAPFPPADLKSVVDDAVNQQKWFNLVLHNYNNDDGAITYAHSNDIWVTSIGNVIKYILQRDRFILSNYTVTSDRITFNASRLPIASSVLKNFEAAFGPNDLLTLQIDINDSQSVDYVMIDGTISPYQIKVVNGNKVLLVNIKLETGNAKSVEIKYLTSAIPLSISGVTANDKVYDGTYYATLNTSSSELVGKVDGDDVTLISTGAYGTFVNKNYGNSKLVTTSGFTIIGADASKYSLKFPTITANIAKSSLTISGVVVNSTVYNGNTEAVLNNVNARLIGVFGSDIVQLVSSGATGTFINKNIGSGKTVTTSGFTLNGSDAGNYSLVQPSLTGDIIKSGLTLTGVTANSKMYDGTTKATLNIAGVGLVGVVGGDNVIINSTVAQGNFIDEKVGTGKTVITSGFFLEGNDSDNYFLIQPTTTSNITGIILNIVGVTANDKVYNRTNSASLNTSNATLIGVSNGDIVNLISSGATGTFDSRNAGVGLTVTASGFILGGADAGKYTLIQPSATADITRADLTISGLTVINKVYDGTIIANLNTGNTSLVGVYAGDVVSLISSNARGTFANKNTGTLKVVATSGFALGGSDAINYNLIQPSGTANIVTATLTISGVTANSKVYDRTTAAIINFQNSALIGVFGGDVVSLVSTNVVGTFINKNVGINKTISVSGFSLDGNDAGNYNLTQPSAISEITPALVTLFRVTANSKVYDRTTTVSLNNGTTTLSGIFSGDIVSLVSTGAVGVFSDKDVGNGKTITVSGYLLSGSDAVNYNLVQPSTTANITKALLTISGVTVNSKIYDGTTSATLNATNYNLAGLLEGDEVSLISLHAIGTFLDKNVGTNKSVTASGFSLIGHDSGNYDVIVPILRGSISPKLLTITANDLSKAYRTSLKFSGLEYTLTGLVTGDVVPFVKLSSPGASAAAEVGKYVISVEGLANNNYSLNFISGVLTVIKPKLIVKAEDKSRIYGSENPVLTVTYSGFIGFEDVSVLDKVPSVSTSALINSPVGSYIISLSGGADKNYDLILIDGSLKIEKATLTITAENRIRVYGEPNPIFNITCSGFVNNEDQSILDVQPHVWTVADLSSDAGNYEIVPFGAIDPNYSFIYNKGTLKITKADQYITFEAMPRELRMTQEYNLIALATSGLEVSFELSEPDAGILDGNKLKVRKDGDLTIKAIQMGNKNWNPAPVVTQSIDVLPTFENISSLFTPNNDGMNDYWYIPDLEQYGKLQVTVYNRFGQSVYQSDAYKNNWDGTWKGSPLPSASYYYLIKSSLKGFIKGVVNIVR